MKLRINSVVTVVMACGFILGSQAIVSAQGRGKGGPPAGVPGGGSSGGPGVGRGISTFSDRSNGRADTGRSTASDRSNGRSDAGLNRAALQRDNLAQADKDLNDHPDMAVRLHTNANDLRAGYRAALLTNPNLKFGQYVAATRLAANLGGRYPQVTTTAILAGLAHGDSIGQTLHKLGVGKDEARNAEKTTEHEIKDARRR